jgi:hypothetical protein
VLLQNCLESQQGVPDVRSESCALSSDDVDQAVNIKIETFSDAEDGEDSVPMTFVGIKAEHEVSCMAIVCPHQYCHLPGSLRTSAVGEWMKS